MNDTKVLLVSFWYWFITQSVNSWVFRIMILGGALLVVATGIYTVLELSRNLKPSARLDRWCAKAFLVWVIVLQAILTCTALLYLFGARLVLI